MSSFKRIHLFVLRVLVVSDDFFILVVEQRHGHYFRKYGSKRSQLLFFSPTINTETLITAFIDLL